MRLLIIFLLSCNDSNIPIDSSIVDNSLTDSQSDSQNISQIDSNLCQECLYVLKDCGQYAPFPNLPITGDAPPGEVCFTTQNYNTLINWKNGNSTWQMCAINK